MNLEQLEKRRIYKREYVIKWRKENPEKRREYKRTWYSRNKEKAKANVQAWRNKYPEKVAALRKKRKASDREFCLKKKYGLTLAQWDALFASQGCVCKICKSTKPNSKNGWHTDHDHKTKRVRGILCHNCNRMLGGALDNVETLKSAIGYLTAV